MRTSDALYAPDICHEHGVQRAVQQDVGLREPFNICVRDIEVRRGVCQIDLCGQPRMLLVCCPSPFRLCGESQGQAF